jgi:hypothetical protein
MILRSEENLLWLLLNKKKHLEPHCLISQALCCWSTAHFSLSLPLSSGTWTWACMNMPIHKLRAAPVHSSGQPSDSERTTRACTWSQPVALQLQPAGEYAHMPASQPVALRASMFAASADLYSTAAAAGALPLVRAAQVTATTRNRHKGLRRSKQGV